MKRLVTLIAALATFAFPALALGHGDLKSITVAKGTTDLGAIGANNTIACGGTTVFDADPATSAPSRDYVRNIEGTWKIAYALPGVHFHYPLEQQGQGERIFTNQNGEANSFLRLREGLIVHPFGLTWDAFLVTVDSGTWILQRVC